MVLHVAKPRLKQRRFDPLNLNRRRRPRKPRLPKEAKVRRISVLSYPALGLKVRRTPLHPVYLNARRNNSSRPFQQVGVKRRLTGYVPLRKRRKLFRKLERQLRRKPPRCLQKSDGKRPFRVKHRLKCERANAAIQKSDGFVPQVVDAGHDGFGGRGASDGRFSRC